MEEKKGKQGKRGERGGWRGEEAEYYQLDVMGDVDTCPRGQQGPGDGLRFPSYQCSVSPHTTPPFLKIAILLLTAGEPLYRELHGGSPNYVILGWIW